jgi:hypothetical protein
MSIKTKSDLEYLLEILEENKGIEGIYGNELKLNMSDFIFYCKAALQRKESDEQKQQQEALNNARTFWNFKNTK